MASKSLWKSLRQAETLALVQRLVCDHLRPYWRPLALGVFCMIITAACTALLARQMQPVIDYIFMEHRADILGLISGMVLALFLLKGLASYGDTVAMTYVGERIVADIRTYMLSHILQADLKFYHSTSSGVLISRFTNDMNLLHNVVSKTITNVVKDGLTLLFLVILMFYQDWLLASIAFIVFPVAILPLVRIGKRMRKSSTAIQQGFSDFTVMLSQIFQGIRLIKAYDRQDQEFARGQQMIETLFQRILKSARIRAATHPLMEVLGGVAIVIVIFYGGSQVIDGNQSPGSFFAFITALLFAYEPMKRLAHLNTDLQEKLAAASRVFALLEIQPTVVNRPQAKELSTPQGNIEFKDVHFSYTRKYPALRGVTFHIPAGQTAALVGMSGSGKSTLMNLLLRFYDVEQGSIMFEGIDIRDIKLESLRRHIALVSQDIMLFDDTIAANIAYGRPSATRQEIIAAAQAADAHGFILELPEGYETTVGEHGVRLSGGQRQRLSIARALLKDAPVLLLDEATSALDSAAEQNIQSALKSLKGQHTLLVIAHRLSTIKDADIIYVMDKGHIIGSGTHAALLKTNPHYAKLCKTQFESSEDKSLKTNDIPLAQASSRP